jgi:hypothetical protein
VPDQISFTAADLAFSSSVRMKTPHWRLDKGALVPFRVPSPACHVQGGTDGNEDREVPAADRPVRRRPGLGEIMVRALANRGLALVQRKPFERHLESSNERIGGRLRTGLAR